jgi:hypothetical protein
LETVYAFEHLGIDLRVSQAVVLRVLRHTKLLVSP